MKHHYPYPAIVGSGLSGLLISLALSQAKVEHLLIGGPPPTTSPRLGESLNLEATIHFLDLLPEFTEYYYQKNFTILYAGNNSAYCSLKLGDNPLISTLTKILGKTSPNGFLHIDRVGLDTAVYTKAINNPYCTHLNTLVTKVHHDPGSDRIHQIDLKDGTTRPVSHLFDATNHVRLVARQLHLPCKTISPTQEVFYTHYCMPDTLNADTERPSWMHRTSILRLYAQRDGFNGMAWCIPLGDKISIGVSTQMDDPDTAALSPEERLETVRKVYEDFGVPYGKYYTVPTRIARTPMEFYTHTRAHGANWMLAGAAYGQAWWTSSSGLDTSFAAAHAAVNFLRSPAETGRLYKEYLDELRKAQEIWDWAAFHQFSESTYGQIRNNANRLIWVLATRFLKAVSLQSSTPISTAIPTLAFSLYNYKIWAHFPAFLCKVYSNESEGFKHELLNQ